MPAKSLQGRLETLIISAANFPDDLGGFRGYRGEAITVEPWMIGALREAEARARRLRRQVEQRLGEAQSRPCARCSKPVTGRPDRRYCSDRCRQGAHRARHAAKVTAPASMAFAVHDPGRA
jgi:hypothetical protein